MVSPRGGSIYNLSYIYILFRVFLFMFFFCKIIYSGPNPKILYVIREYSIYISRIYCCIYSRITRIHDDRTITSTLYLCLLSLYILYLISVRADDGSDKSRNSYFSNGYNFNNTQIRYTVVGLKKIPTSTHHTTMHGDSKI